MKKQRISDLYEDFEPETRIWPYFVLGLLIPLVPLVLTGAVGGEINWIIISKFIISSLPLIFTALVMQDGEKAWLLPISGGIYGVMQLVYWVIASLENGVNMPLGIPFTLALSPLLLSFIAYSFFQKRKRGKWLGFTLLSLIFAITFTVLCVMDDGNIMIDRGIYPLFLVILTLMIFVVTRRSDSTPWFIVLTLIALLISSSLFHSGILGMIEDGSKQNVSFFSAFLGIFVHDFEFWYTLSFFFIFAGLANKSSYRTVLEDIPSSEESVGEDIADSFNAPPSDSPQRRGFTLSSDSKYTFPPEYSRYNGEDEPPRKEPYEEQSIPKTPPRPLYGEEYREKNNPDDKWYEFIQGGVKEEDSRDRRDDSYYRDERRPRGSSRDRYRDDLMYPPRYEEDRRRREREDYRDSRYIDYDERDRYRDKDYRYRDIDDDYDDRRYRRPERDYRDRDYDYRDRDRDYRGPRDWDD